MIRSILICYLLNFATFSFSKGIDTIPHFSHNTSIGYVYNDFMGDNIYNKYHTRFEGFYITTGILIFKHLSLDVSASKYSGRVTNTSFINEYQTTIKNSCISGSYVYYPNEKLALSTSLIYRSVIGKNQGKFYGSGFGAGISLKYHIFKYLYLEFGTETGIMNFNIKTPPDLQDQFSKTSFILMKAGMGLRLF
ncbi:MAG: hypothetical protein ACM3PT_03405 [Deltaproteobacteria bacterium]